MTGWTQCAHRLSPQEETAQIEKGRCRSQVFL